jgi:competence protein ComEA
MITLKKLVSLLVVVSFLTVFSGALYSSTQKQAADSKSVKVNINTAGVDQLVKLPRIGEKIAKRIIEFREKNGKFKKIQDLMKVKGIGEKTFKKFEKMLTV